MKPTNKLRFIERNEPVILRGEKFDNWRKVLQQWWEDDEPEIIEEYNGFTTMRIEGEWRDVPLEKEA